GGRVRPHHRDAPGAQDRLRRGSRLPYGLYRPRTAARRGAPLWQERLRPLSLQPAGLMADGSEERERECPAAVSPTPICSARRCRRRRRAGAATPSSTLSAVTTTAR